MPEVIDLTQALECVEIFFYLVGALFILANW